MTHRRLESSWWLVSAALVLSGAADAQDRLGVEFRANSYTPNSQFFPVVAAEANGDFVVVWYSSGQDGDSYGIFGRRFSSAGGGLATEFQVNTRTTNYQGLPSVAADDDGDFVVAWQSFLQDGDANGVFARRFSSVGAALATEFQVNSYTTGSQLSATVALDADGDFVVAWVAGSDQDGSSNGVFGRRFSSAGLAF